MNKIILLIDEYYKSPLSNQIKKEYNKLITKISEIPINLRNIKIIEGTGGKISILI